MSNNSSKHIKRKNAGRPPLPDSQKKIRVSMTMSKSTLNLIDEARGGTPRSKFIESKLQPNLDMKEKHHNKKNGVVYTPSNLANYVAGKVVDYFFNDLSCRNKTKTTRKALLTEQLEKIKILDPACGDGELLISTWKALSKRVSKTSHLLDNADSKLALCGIDIDQKAINKARTRIASLSETISNKGKFNLIKTNALAPFNRKTLNQGWKIISSRFQADNGYDIVIANPPWGADTEPYKDNLSAENYSLYKGQFDSSDLFIELANKIVRPGGYFAFILPDSLFGNERSPLRKILLNQTEIKFIGRFGEKIFKNINRACVVIICRKSKPTALTSTNCLRLTPQLRKAILKEERTFKDAEKMLAHKVYQSRFINNKDCLFDIDVKESERQNLQIFKNFNTTLQDYLSNSRGIELSKHGRVCKCNECDMWMPVPNAQSPTCRHCKTVLSFSTIDHTSIVNSDPADQYEPLLVGENIKRYHIKSNYWIATDKIGINYKDNSLYKGPKILVRKTGVGLSATIDYQNFLTNQVVYMFRQKPSTSKSLDLELFLAIINSRAMYYYLVKSHGETEWRSHPYLTQKQILSLPFPGKNLTTPQGMTTAKHIVQLLKPHLLNKNELPPNVDAKVEYLVSSLYGLTKKHYENIYKTLGEVEELLPIRALKRISITDIFSSRT